MFKKKTVAENTTKETVAEVTKPTDDGVQPEKAKDVAEGKDDVPSKSGPSAEGVGAEPAEGPKDGDKTEVKAEPDWKTLYAVTLADFDNYKKRAARDREDVYRYAESDILKDVLPTVDNLGLALEKAENKDDPFVKGVRLVYDGLVKTLADHGAKMMPELVGKELDPNFHEAIATLPNAEIEEGKISNIVKTGWLLNDKLLRAAQVVVSAGAPAK